MSLQPRLTLTHSLENSFLFPSQLSSSSLGWRGGASTQWSVLGRTNSWWPQRDNTTKGLARLTGEPNTLLREKPQWLYSSKSPTKVFPFQAGYLKLCWEFSTIISVSWLPCPHPDTCRQRITAAAEGGGQRTRWRTDTDWCLCSSFFLSFTQYFHVRNNIYFADICFQWDWVYIMALLLL